MRDVAAPRRAGVLAWTLYIVASLQIVALLSFIGQYALGPGTANTSGGAEMALFFFNLLPLALILAGLALFRFARWRALRLLASRISRSRARLPISPSRRQPGGIYAYDRLEMLRMPAGRPGLHQEAVRASREAGQ